MTALHPATEAGLAGKPAGTPADPDAEPVRYEVTDGVAVLTLNRPHRLNAVTPPLVDALVRGLERARAEEVGAAVLHGTGRAFCSGHDLKQDTTVKSEAEDRNRTQRLQDVTRAVRQAPFPVIAAVHGYALGAGCEFALCSDLVVAGTDAVFGFPEVSVGLGVTGGISHLLPHIVGPAKAKELVLLGERFSAEEAYRLNLVNRLVEPGRHLDTALEWARTLRDKPRRALARAKFALDLGLQTSIETAYETEVSNALALHNTPDATNASQAFQQR